MEAERSVIGTLGFGTVSLRVCCAIGSNKVFKYLALISLLEKVCLSVLCNLKYRVNINDTTYRS